MQAIYFDTASGCLSAHGISIRLRKEGRRWIQTAKAATADPLRRLEHNVIVATLGGSEEPLLDLSLHDGEPVGKALRGTLAQCQAGQRTDLLSKRFQTDVLRTSRSVRIDGARVGLSFDFGRIFAGIRSTPVCEFELELVSGDAAALIALSRRWAGLHKLWLSTASKAERGSRLARSETLGQPLQATFACVKKDANQGPFLVATIAGCMTQVIGNASQVGAGSNDEEVVHQLRIGLRHLRTALRELRANRHGADPAWAPVLRGVFKELGVHRDRLVVIPNIRAELLEAGSSPLGNRAGRAGDRSLVQVARDPALQQTLLDILTFLHRPVKLINATSRSDGKARRLVAGRLDKLHRLIARDVERFSALQPARQHRVRKRVGRLLFLSVAAEPIFERKHVERYIKSWREAQFSLGKSNDLRTGNDALIAGAFQGAGAEFAAEWLPERRRKSAKHCQRALRKVMKKPVFWGK